MDIIRQDMGKVSIDILNKMAGSKCKGIKWMKSNQFFDNLFVVTNQGKAILDSNQSFCLLLFHVL
jgi:hypothetical protein